MGGGNKKTDIQLVEAAQSTWVVNRNVFRENCNHGERQNSDEVNGESGEPASDLLEAPEGAAQES
ncbi:uncharacterized protein J3R85_012668 [Psidium guajava]|nr:uncharacterized protein J3R85_012668 [Psidium guajava]